MLLGSVPSDVAFDPLNDATVPGYSISARARADVSGGRRGAVAAHRARALRRAAVVPGQVEPPLIEPLREVLLLWLCPERRCHYCKRRSWCPRLRCCRGPSRRRCRLGSVQPLPTSLWP